MAPRALFPRPSCNESPVKAGCNPTSRPPRAFVKPSSPMSCAYVVGGGCRGASDFDDAMALALPVAAATLAFNWANLSIEPDPAAGAAEEFPPKAPACFARIASARAFASATIFWMSGFGGAAEPLEVGTGEPLLDLARFPSFVVPSSSGWGLFSFAVSAIVTGGHSPSSNLVHTLR